MALIKGKQTEVTFKKVELTEEKQKESQKYVVKLNSLLEYKQGLISKSAAAAERNQQIQEELEQLNVEHALEIDPGKLKEIDSKRKELKGEAVDLVSIGEQQIRKVIRESVKSQEVKDMGAASDYEQRVFAKEVDGVIKELESEIERLKLLKKEHLNTHAMQLRARVFD